MPTKVRQQAFLSSTYLDLRAERQELHNTLISMDCFPAGMELFPAVSGQPMEHIKREIDECDYYVVVIGWRYGTAVGAASSSCLCGRRDDKKIVEASAPSVEGRL